MSDIPIHSRLAAAFIVFPALVLLALLPLRPPAVTGPEVPPSEFSAGRALVDVRAIARAPHPLGSPQQARVRDWLVRRLAELGLAAEIQHGDAEVQNVLARLEGSGAGKHAILLMAHYDSVRQSPGASDNGAGVAALLETLRALRASAPPVNDVIFLFSDGEEAGLLGAYAFADHHPWAADVRLVANFEARGTRGPAVMFETGRGTGPLMRRFAAAVPHPLAYSYAYDVYRTLPNDTDFSVFRWDLPGFNFAYIHGAAAYHTADDTVERLDPRSLQHHGDNALGLVRSFGASDLGNLPRQGEAIYFCLPALGLVVYPASWALPLMALVVVLAAAVFYRGVSRGHLRWRRVLAGLLAFPATVIAAMPIVTLLDSTLARIFSEPAGQLTAVVLIAAAVIAALLMAFARWLGAADLSASMALWWLLLGLLAVLYLPSTSYLLAWPLAFSLLALAAFFARPQPLVGARLWAVLLLATAPAVLLWAPTIAILGTALGVQGANVLVLPVALCLNLLSLQLALLAGMQIAGMQIAGMQIAGMQIDSG